MPAAAEDILQTKESVERASQTDAANAPAPERNNETVEEFVKRYYATYARAKTELDFEEFRKRSSKSSPAFPLADLAAEKLVKPLVDMYLKSVPAAVKILSKSTMPDGSVRLELAPDTVPENFAQASKVKGFSMRGYSTVERVGEQWRIRADYWKVKTGPSSGELSFGYDPDNEYAKKISLAHSTAVGFSQDFEGRYRDLLMEKFPSPWAGEGEVHVSFRMANGHNSEILAKDKKNRVPAEQFIKKVISQCPAKETIPSIYKNKPCVWMYFNWKGGSFSVSGPYFEERMPDWLSYEMGVKKRPFDNLMVDKLMKSLDKQQSTGAATVYLKLKKDGAIEKVFVRSNDKIAERTAYDAVCKAHPFGALSPELLATPYFKLRLNWEPSSKGVVTEHLTTAPQWLK